MKFKVRVSSSAESYELSVGYTSFFETEEAITDDFKDSSFINLLACLNANEYGNELFDKINKEGKTIIMATHNMEIVKKYKKRIVNVVGGKISK